MRALVLLAFAAAAAADAKEEAWFAFRAGEQGDKEAVPRLVDALAKEPAARRWVLDALIRLKGEVPAEGVVGLFEEFPEETLILLARDPEKNEEHLAAIAEASGANELYLHWVAACNLLVGQKSKRLAAPLLRDLGLTLDVSVVDPHFLGGRGAGRRGGGGKVNKKGVGGDPLWPPRPHYALAEVQGGDAVPLATGRVTVFFVRSLPDRGKSVLVRRGMRHGQRLQYLADLLGVERMELGFAADNVATVVWRGAEAYPGDVAAARERVEKGYRDMVAKLVEKGFLDPREAPKAPRLKVTVTDWRTDKSVALPALQGVETKPA